jgi:hypothetical protein
MSSDTHRSQALIQESIQAAFRGVIPRFDDDNAFTGDAVGGGAALLLAFAVTMWRSMRS